MSRVAIFSPAAAGSIGHGFVYAMNLCEHLGRENDITLFTIDSKEKKEALQSTGVRVITSSAFMPGSIDKNRFNRFRFLKSIIYGFYRIWYNYRLLSEFYRRNRGAEIYHLLEFEYMAFFLMQIFRREEVSRTIIGLHIADFIWIKGRSFSVNLYKWLLRRPVEIICRRVGHITTHGAVIRELLIKDINVSPAKITSVEYGCNVKLPEMSKEEARKLIGLSGEERKIALFFGVMRRDKGLLEVLRSFSQISEEVLLLIAGGEGDISRETVLRVIDEEGINDRVYPVLNYIDEERIGEYFTASDFVLIPHKGDHLAFSGPLSLAVEYCRPVVASNIGEIGNFVERNSIGDLFMVDDWEDFIRITNGFLFKVSTFEVSQFCTIQKENSWPQMARRITGIYASFLNE